MERLCALDLSFLDVETDSAHMHVGWLSHLELPPGADRLELDGLRATIAARLHLVPRFRQRVVSPALRLGKPLWSDDAEFDLARHVVAAPEPVGRVQLRKLADEFLSAPLPRDRPLWKLLVFPRVEPSGAALVGKVHHAMVDGIAAVELGVLLFDGAPQADRTAPSPWRPRRREGAVGEALDLAAGRARDAERAARRMITPMRGVREVIGAARAAQSLASDALRPAPGSFLNPRIGPGRTLATASFDLRDLDRAKRASGVKLNDIVLALTTGALRRLCMARGELPSDLRAMIPVSTRAARAEAAGNEITFCFVTLPLSLADPGEQLTRIHSQTADLKRSGRIAGSELLMRSLLPQLPGALRGQVARLAASPRLFNLTVSNVPGPPQSLYAAGARVASIHPVIPLSEGHALALGVLSYDGLLHFAAHADPTRVDASRIPAYLSQALADLLGGAARGHRRSARRQLQRSSTSVPRGSPRRLFRAV